jgi:hypothetical protein
MRMPFEFIDGLNVGSWHHIGNRWLTKLTKHLKQAQSSNIKQIRFIRHIGRHKMYATSAEYETKDDCYIFKIIQMSNTKCYVNYGQISNIIGEEE